MKNKALIPLLVALLLVIGLYALRFSLPVPAETPLTAVAPSVGIARFFNGVQSEALEGLTVVKKIYRLPEDTLVAPKPREDGYLHTSDRAQVLALIDEAAELIGERDVVFDENTDFLTQYGVDCYRDDSILTLVWSENRKDQYGMDVTLTFSEVFLADASQFRRKLACDEYGVGIHKFPSDMALEVNAVLATSGDFYRFRPCGINVYQRQLYRCDGEKVDTCWIDEGGNLLFTRAGEIMDTAAAEAFIADNNILFTLSFGPVMIENGANVVPDWYYLGELNLPYSRACIAQDGELHYLLCMIKDFVTVSTAADWMVEKGVERCFALDGGQTGTVVMRGTMLNPSVYGLGNAAQRIQSDIIYFATAIPENE